MTTPPDLLDAARTDPTTRGVLADCIEDCDGKTPAVDAALRMACEACGCPERFGRLVCVDRHGAWHGWEEVHSMNSDVGADLFPPDLPGGFDHPRFGQVALYRDSGRWHLVCPHCEQRLVAKVAAATRAANRATVAESVPCLFSNAED